MKPSKAGLIDSFCESPDLKRSARLPPPLKIHTLRTHVNHQLTVLEGGHTIDFQVPVDQPAQTSSGEVLPSLCAIQYNAGLDRGLFVVVRCSQTSLFYKVQVRVTGEAFSSHPGGEINKSTYPSGPFLRSFPPCCALRYLLLSSLCCSVICACVYDVSDFGLRESSPTRSRQKLPERVYKSSVCLPPVATARHGSLGLYGLKLKL